MSTSSHGTLEAPLRLTEVDFGLLRECMPGVTLTGDNYERGKMYGQAFAEKITANVGRHVDHPNLPPLEFCLTLILDYYIPGLQYHWHAGWEELQGMSEGCGIDVEFLVLLNVREDLVSISHLPEGAPETTTAFFLPRATADESAILAHSFTVAKPAYDLDLMHSIEVRPGHGLANIFMVVEAGMLSGCGMNSSGLAVAANAIYSSLDCAPGGDEPYFPVTCLERYLLASATLDTAGDIIGAMAIHASRHVIVANAEGRSRSLECTPRRGYSHTGPIGATSKLHGNHFQSFDAYLHRDEVTDRYRGPASQDRVRRLQQLVDDVRSRTGGRATPQQVRAMFSDHVGGGGGGSGSGTAGMLCMHREAYRPNMTAGLAMFDTRRRVVSVCKGPPCRGTMMHFRFQAIVGGDNDEESNSTSSSSDSSSSDGSSSAAASASARASHERVEDWFATATASWSRKNSPASEGGSAV
ncbi:hypothetical protein C8A05DRAFT_18900 [Staphylotrichum tortipilum]|uniref:Peptidase C45 hydrolase domain-containing protein n=1 Tax=Staphylotrichum tortipilum TaxID=2831512 RepID=A0AAN6MCU2_9PEZI|nr:hypothetical protein C8A05DRAFT_18900 [Staphylotrichum longicolle]